MADKKGTAMGSVAVAAGIAFALAAALLAAGAALGSRFGWWNFSAGFAALGWIAWVGAAGAVLSLIGAALSWNRHRGALIVALVGLVLGATAAWLPYQGRAALRASPPLPDITTDTADPPAFVAAIESRRQAGARNSTDYRPARAALQARHYPDIAPVIVPLAPDAAFDRALAVVRAMGLEIIATDKTSGRIEATATTFWFGFKDDVVIRVRPAPEGARIDIRSTSRVGGRDAGTNAARVRDLARRIRGN